MAFNTPFAPAYSLTPSLQVVEPNIMAPNTNRVAPSPEHWERHRPVIKRLFLDENKKLKEVAQIMATQYGHFATPRMYRDRTKKWKIEKKHKESDMFAILRKHTERAAVGKRTAFRVQGQTVTMDQVTQYLRRKRKMIDQEAYDAPTPSDISYRTPSPMPIDISTKNHDQPVGGKPLLNFWETTQKQGSLFPASAYNFESTEIDDQKLADTSCFVEDEKIIEMTLKTMYSLLSNNQDIHHSPSAPHTLLIPERLFLTVKTYVEGSFDKGTWITGEDGYCTSIALRGSHSQRLLGNFENYCNTAVQFLARGLHVNFRRTLSNGFKLVKDIIQSEHPLALDYFLDNILFFRRNRRSEIAEILRKYFCDVAESVCTQSGPWAHIGRLIAALEEDTLEQAVIQAWKCKIDGFERSLGQFHQSSLEISLDFIRCVHESVNVVEEEKLLQGLLAQWEAGSCVSKKQTLSIRINLGWSLMDQGRCAEAEELGLAALTVAEEQYWYEEKIRALQLISESQYRREKRTSAANNLQQAVDLSVDKWGVTDPGAIDLMLRLEGWLRGWGREVEGDELKAKVEEAIGRDEIDQELDGR
ncbi:uncharacterized protein PAC_15556 [Phialocephala subalpina]|uniref:Clr5 domain-containing protein n=1 Tax=Phialocephala subalpina TaxID=576137 RepID=A0A1L7XL53_9HELO|nr:uncharacterized protein PAC_15556 [Phialocephala subalpina]